MWYTNNLFPFGRLSLPILYCCMKAFQLNETPVIYLFNFNIPCCWVEPPKVFNYDVMECFSFPVYFLVWVLTSMSNLFWIYFVFLLFQFRATTEAAHGITPGLVSAQGSLLAGAWGTIRGAQDQIWVSHVQGKHPDTLCYCSGPNYYNLTNHTVLTWCLSFSFSSSWM